jgi:hypothetical protein
MPAPDLAALEAAGRALLPDLPADTVTVWNACPAAALLFVTLDASEHERRQRAHAKPLTNRNALALLMGLPHGARIPLATLTEREQELLRFVPHGAATVDFGHITRLATRPLTVHLAVVPPQAPRRAINRASQYRPFCIRGMVGHRRSRRPGHRTSGHAAPAEALGAAAAHGRALGVHRTRLPAAPLHTAAPCSLSRGNTPRPARHPETRPTAKETVMKALTVRQPYANAIVHGEKRTENRSQRTHYRGALLIHAALAPHGSGVASAELGGDGWPDQRGAIIGVAELADCHRATDSCCTPWGFTGYWHWQLGKVTALAQPVPAKGKLGLWTPDDDVLAAVQAQLQEAAA